jgi:hypothetical protein
MAKSRAEFRSNEEDDDDGHVKLELLMENAGAPGSRTRVASSFSVDEWVESSAPYDGPEGWPEWKQDDDLVYQQYLDDVFRGDVG